MFNNLDLINLGNSKQKVLNFDRNYANSIRKDLFRDIDFLTSQVITNYSLQFIIEKMENSYLYHFGICDYTN